MKVIAIFSGKGGVGKSTVAALFAMALSKTKKVALMDLDVNTPSIPVMFGEEKEIGNLKLFSTGFDYKKTIIYTGKMMRASLDSLAKKVKDSKPDVCIMDMPPGTSDVHLKVSKNMNPSSFILVMQSNKLCEEDGIRACQLFSSIDSPVAGVIENMTGEVFGDADEKNILGFPVLAKIPLNKKISDLGNKGLMGTVKNNPLEKVAEDIYKNAIDVKWTLESTNNWNGPSEKAVMGSLFKYDYPETHKYYGLASWNAVREEMMDFQYLEYMVDRRINDCNYDTIKRIFDNLNTENVGMFMITKAVDTAIKVFPGEIGMGRVELGHKSYYGLPRIIYDTDEGELHLFPNEVKPVSIDELKRYLGWKEHIQAKNSTATRYLPTADTLQQLGNAFGMTVSGWEEKYKELGVINAQQE